MDLDIKEENLPALLSEDEAEDHIPFSDNEETDDDVILATNTVKETMAKMSSVFDEMHHLAQDSDSPKAYDVLNAMAANINNIASTLVKIKRWKKPNQDSTTVQNNTTNNTLICSPMDIIKQLKTEPQQQIEE